MLPEMFPDLVDREDVWVVEVGRGFGLGMEAGHIRRTGQLAGQDHLERDFAIQRNLPGSKDHSHPTPSDLRNEFVIPKIADRAVQVF